MKKLSERQIAFAKAYAKYGVGAQALAEAGYSSKSAQSGLAARLLQKSIVVAEVLKYSGQEGYRNEVSKERLIAEIAHLAYSCVDDYEIVNGQLCAKPDAPIGAMRAIAWYKRRERATGEIEYEFKLWDKPGVLKLAGQTLGIFIDKHEVTGKDGGPIQVQIEERILTSIEIADLRARLT